MRKKHTFKLVLFCLVLAFTIGYCSSSEAAKPKVRAKFYDFSDQLIDGTVKKPQTLYTDVRQKAKFGRLLRLKRDFIKDSLFKTARDPVFK
tara:strand:+ start:657 stop:929 length:273 start_codon:yes stop_codon:yes gene_type:complete